MKIDITIRDASYEDAQRIVSLFSTTSSAAIINHMPNSTVAAENDESETGPANSNAPAFDSAGLPWDDRIHSKNKSTNADGTWRKKRNLDANMVAGVEAELRARGGAPMTAPPMIAPPNTTMPMPAVPPMPGAPSPTPMPPNPAPMPNMAPPAAPAPAPAPVAPPPAATMDFAGFMSHLSVQMNSKIIDAAYLQNLVGRINPAAGTAFTVITDLSTRPDLLPWVVSIITTDQRW